MKFILKIIKFVCRPFYNGYRMAEHHLNTIDAHEKCNAYLKEMNND